MIIFYRNNASPNVEKITLMLAETGLPHIVQSVDRAPDGTFVESFRAINPHATVPAIHDRDNGLSVFESGAILIYLAEKSGKFLPTELIARTQVIQWLAFEVANMGPTMGELYYYLLQESNTTTEGLLQRYRDKLMRYCALFDRKLENRTYLCDDYSIADMALYPWCGVLADIADIHLADYPHLSQWVATIAARKATQRIQTTGPIIAKAPVINKGHN